MDYLLNYYDLILRYFGEHLLLSFSALVAASLIALPLGFYLYNHPKLAAPVLGLLGMFYTIPSIALIILLIPAFGLNKTSVFMALVIYNQIILARNTVVGLEGIDPAIREAAIGMGMSRFQIARDIELPLALPVILAGIRIAATVSIAIATIGAKFGAGGLGTLLFEGISQSRMDKLWIGTLAVVILALGISTLLKFLENSCLASQTACE